MTEQHQEPNVEDTTAEQTAPPAAPTADTPEAQLAVLEAKVAELQDAYLRAKAESENMRRRAAEDVTKAHKFAVEKFARELIAVGDSLDAALADTAADAATLRSGVELTQKQLLAAFERGGMRVENPAPGDKFDPNQHHGRCRPTGQHRGQCPAKRLSAVGSRVASGHGHRRQRLRPRKIIVQPA